MDRTTEPIIAVIGNPIAGNPSQFAVERALKAMKLDWRVLSFDVRPEDVAAALEGFSVTGIAGVLIDPSVTDVASKWYTEKASGESEVIDCLYRDEEGRFVGNFEERGWVDEQIRKHTDHAKIWFGSRSQNTPLSDDTLAAEANECPPDPDTIESAALIAICDGPNDGVVDLEAEDWPENDGSTLVLDLTEGHPELATVRSHGYRVVATRERQIGTLQRCMNRWTDARPPSDVIHDAIEEYLGV